MPAVVNVLVRRATDADLEAVQNVGHRTWPTTYEPIAGADFVAMGLAKWWSVEAIRPLITQRPRHRCRGRRGGGGRRRCGTA